MTDPSSTDTEHPRPVILTDELKAQLNKVSTATLTQQLQGRGIRNAFLSGLKPVVEGQRMVGYAHTLRYVPAREDLTDLTRGQNAQRRAIESLTEDEVLVIDAARRARRGHDRRHLRDAFEAARRRRRRHRRSAARHAGHPHDRSARVPPVVARRDAGVGCTCRSITRSRSRAQASP